MNRAVRVGRIRLHEVGNLKTHGGVRQRVAREFEERAKLMAWFHGWKDDEWDEQMKRDIASGTLDNVLREVEADIKAGRVRELP
jgi:hypothetical protein